eukprot:6211304-Pleurochrysis_carterae.AAC.2
MASSASDQTTRFLRSRSSAITSSTKPERGKKRGVISRSGSGTMGGTFAHCVAIHKSVFSRFSSAASCASTAFISSSDRTTSKEPMERLRLDAALEERPPLGAGAEPASAELAAAALAEALAAESSTAPAAASLDCLRCCRISRSRSRLASTTSLALYSGSSTGRMPSLSALNVSSCEAANLVKRSRCDRSAVLALSA